MTTLISSWPTWWAVGIAVAGLLSVATLRLAEDGYRVISRLLVAAGAVPLPLLTLFVGSQLQPLPVPTPPPDLVGVPRGAARRRVGCWPVLRERRVGLGPTRE